MAASIDSLHIDPDISRAWSVPAPFYTNPSVLALEQEKIFGKTWQVVGHCHQLAKQGDFFTAELQGEPLLLVRGAGGELRSFFNVAAIAPAHPPRAADHENSSVAATTVGPTGSMVR
jgi:hypothetical protein